MKKESEILKARAYEACLKIISSLDKVNDLRVMPVYDSKDFVIMTQEAWDRLSQAIQAYDNTSDKIGISSLDGYESEFAKVFCLAEVLVDDNVFQIPTVNDLHEFQNAMDVFCEDTEYIMVHVYNEPGETYNKSWQHDYMDYQPRYVSNYTDWLRLFPNNWV